MNTHLHTLRESLESRVQKTDEQGIEFWFARDLQAPLGYARWENFQTAINRAIGSCEAANQLASDHFRGVTKMIETGKGANRPVEDLTKLARRVKAEEKKLAKQHQALPKDSDAGGTENE